MLMWYNLPFYQMQVFFTFLVKLIPIPFKIYKNYFKGLYIIKIAIFNLNFCGDSEYYLSTTVSQNINSFIIIRLLIFN